MNALNSEITKQRVTKGLLILAIGIARLICLSPIIGMEPSAKAADFVTRRDLTQAERAAVAKPVSMVALIANPKSYDTKVIAVKGYLHIQ